MAFLRFCGVSNKVTESEGLRCALKGIVVSLLRGLSSAIGKCQRPVFRAPQLALALATSLSAATAAIKLGEVDSLTGGVSQFGIGCHQGFVLAFEQINAEGGILGQQIELVTEDDQSKPGQSATAVRKLITQDKVLAILGDATSSATLEAAPIAQTDKIPMITPTATNPRITEVGDFIFRVCFLDEFQGRVLARFAREKLKAQRIFTLTDVKQDYSVDLLKFFKDEFTKLGGTIVGEQSYSTG